MMPKVLVGCPTSDLKGYALERYIRGIKDLNYENFDILLVDNSKTDNYLKKIKKLGLPVVKGTYNDSARQRIIDSRNIIRQKVLDGDYEYFFSLEQDVVPPPDMIQKLLGHNKKIVSGVYFTYQIDKGINVGLTPVLRKKVGKDGLVIMSKEDVVQPRFMEVGACGLGCVLIHRDVLEKIKFRFSEDYEGFDDI
ncbi:MAG: glycosyltransferase family A protein, partial [Nanoarchaeota archaeon]|nr:glycosyltransferase family A protein [Nanoarchaeota archaeon]